MGKALSEEKKPYPKKNLIKAEQICYIFKRGRNAYVIERSVLNRTYSRTSVSSEIHSEFTTRNSEGRLSIRNC